MLLFPTTSTVMRVVTSSTANLDVHVSWVDRLSGTDTPNYTDTTIASAATTTILAAPAVSTCRNARHVSIANRHATASNTIQVQHYDGTAYQLINLTLAAGEQVHYNDTAGWVKVDAAGGRVETPLTGRFVKRTIINAGTTSFVASPQTNSIIARILAGGGQGGGCPATTGMNGSGGGSGGYAEWAVVVVPNTTYACVVGAKGSTSGTNAAGQDGADSTLTIGATTVTTKGGKGGAVGNSISIPVLGGAGGAVSTNGTINSAGDCGEPNVCTGTALNNRSGKGADSPFGGGGGSKLNASNATGDAATGFGAGGSGGSTTGTVHAGGAGSDGIIIIDEYS